MAIIEFADIDKQLGIEALQTISCLCAWAALVGYQINFNFSNL